MPSTRRIIPWTSKPPLGPGVNWSNPLAKGLLAFFALNEGGGAPVDLAYGVALTPNSTGNGTWGQDANGLVYTTNVAGYGAACATPSWLQIQPPMTMVLSTNILRPTSAANAIGFAVTRSNVSVAPLCNFGI